MDGIPVVDFKKILSHKTLNKEDPAVQEVAHDLCKAFSTIGFAYIINHGVPDKKIKSVRDVSTSFFTLPRDIKRKYQRDYKDENNNGWVAIEQEKLNPERPGDYKEAFNCTPFTAKAKTYPDDVVPGFKDTLLDFCDVCDELSKKVLHLTGIGLNLKEPDLFVRHHNTKTSRNVTTTRCLYYPPMPDDVEIKPNQIRCGEHSDYGSITLLFQDAVGGLEVLNRENKWVQAIPVEGSVVVNIGDLMQRWTADVLVSTRHRVLIPEDDIKKKTARQSIAFFVHPDDECLVECIDGSNKYEPITSGDYLKMRFAVTY